MPDKKLVNAQTVGLPFDIQIHGRIVSQLSHFQKTVFKNLGASLTTFGPGVPPFPTVIANKLATSGLHTLARDRCLISQLLIANLAVESAVPYPQHKGPDYSVLKTTVVCGGMLSFSPDFFTEAPWKIGEAEYPSGKESS